MVRLSIHHNVDVIYLWLWLYDTDFQIPLPISSLSEKPVQESLTGCNKTLVTEWSVQEVVNWLKSRGFDQDVCDKFIGESNYFFRLTEVNHNSIWQTHKDHELHCWLVSTSFRVCHMFRWSVAVQPLHRCHSSISVRVPGWVVSAHDSAGSESASFVCWEVQHASFVLATTITPGHARSTVPAVALLRSFVGDGNGEGRVGRLVEMGGATGFHSKGGRSMLFGFEAANHAIGHGISERGRQCGREEDLVLARSYSYISKNCDLSRRGFRHLPAALAVDIRQPNLCLAHYLCWTLSVSSIHLSFFKVRYKASVTAFY